jgi:hypothetical protein
VAERWVLITDSVLEELQKLGYAIRRSASAVDQFNLVLENSRAPEPFLFQGAEPKAKKKGNPNHAPAVRMWDEAYREKYGEPWRNWSRGARCIKELLASLHNDLALLRKVFGRYLNDDDPFIVKQKHPLPFLAANVDRWTTPLQEEWRPAKIDRELIRRLETEDD